MLWPKHLSKKIKTGINLAGYTSFKIGGQAEYFFAPSNLESLQQVLKVARASDLRIFILGAGTNILVSDSGLKGLVISLNRKYFCQLGYQSGCLIAGSGVKLNKLLSFAIAKSLGGFEFLAGIPGSLGGSLMGNAGAWGHTIGGLVKQLTVLDYQGRLKQLYPQDCKFAYRQSNLNKYIILSAKLQAYTADKMVITAKIKENLLQRKLTQNQYLPNAGCIFKNPHQGSAGRLIDLCGLKGKTQGGAAICRRHANFILNTAQAKSRDVLYLMNLMQRRVKKKFRIDLKPEIKIWK